MTYETEPLSPELALVDPELGERARRALRAAAAKAEPAPSRADGVDPREADALAPPQPETPRSLASPLRPARARPARALRVAAALAVPSVILNVALLGDAADRDRRAAVTVTASVRPAVEGARSSMPSPLPPASPTAAPPGTTPAPPGPDAAPRTAARPRVSTAPVTLRWSKDSRARLYDVIVWRDGRRVKDVWTRKPAVPVRRLACVGEAVSLDFGRYLWFVYPVYAPGSPSRHGTLLRWGSFDVTRETCGPRLRGRTR